MRPSVINARSHAVAVADLADLFARKGYVRRPNLVRRAAEGAQTYKKGFEVRLIADSRAELGRIQALLRTAGFTPGRPFAKGAQYRQPLYGRDVVQRFLALVGAGRPPGRRRKTPRTR